VTSLAKAGKTIKTRRCGTRESNLLTRGCRLFFRTVTKTHIPKRHLDFENPVTGPGFDNTSNRIYGESRPELMTTNNTEYGTAKNKADGVTRVGRKNQMMEREIERQVMLEMQERQDKLDALT